jgi:hypothetical protein
MPSRFEGLPIAGIEAVGTGLPCIFSDIAPLRELGASVALWAAANDPQQLAEKLLAMRTMKWIVPVETSNEFRLRFGIEKTAMNYRHHYDHIKNS